MAVKVVDASALSALLFGEPEGRAVAERLRDADLIAPPLLGFEIASICLKKIRRYPSQREVILEAFDMARRMPIAIVEIEHGGTLRLAEQTGLSAYDASYLWLSQRHDGELVTLDKRLVAAVRRLAPAR